MIKKLLVTLLLFIMLAPFGSAEIDSSTKEALQIVRNRLASTKDRLKSMEALKSAENPDMLTDLLNIIRDPEDSIVVRGRAIEMLTASHNPSVQFDLKKLSSDPSLPSETRRLVLYNLWKLDREEFAPELMKIAQNQSEPTEVRAACISYLSQVQTKYPPDFWKNLFANKGNPIPVRIAALNSMEELKILIEEQTIFKDLLEDPTESFELRKSIVLTAGRIFSPTDFQTEMMAIISKQKNPMDIRKFALDNVAAHADQTLIPWLKEILVLEKNQALAGELETLITDLKSKIG